ncbi:MAG: hypothetical protein QM755_12970 [Luteolibacter sp.]
MAARGRQTTLKSLLLVVVAACLWGWDLWQKPNSTTSRSQPGKPRVEQSPTEAPSSSPAGPSAATQREGRYEVYRGCTLANEKHNDGDSFEVRLPDGRTEVFRLYFVDTPESEFRTYRGGDDNYTRIKQQAEYFGGITSEQAVEIGHRAKEFTLPLLAKRPFTLYTLWDSPFNDQRYHAFIQVEDGGKSRWLDELLVERGFCRIFTKGADMPDGTPLNRRKDQLHAMEREAKARRAGAWGLR